MDEQGGESMTTTHMNAHFTILGSCRAGCNLVSVVQRKEKEKKTAQNFRTMFGLHYLELDNRKYTLNDLILLVLH